MNMFPEDKTSIVGNCALLALLFVSICLVIVCFFVVPFDDAHQEQWLGIGTWGVLSIILTIQQVSMIRKKLTIRKAEEEDMF